MSSTKPLISTENKDLESVNDKFVKAAERGDCPEVRRLLDLGASIHARYAPTGKFNNGNNEFISDGGRSQDGMVRSLKLNAKEAEFEAEGHLLARTALQAASDGGHEEVVELLISRGAEINAAPARYRGRTALQAAAEGGHEGIVKILMDAKADVNASPAKYGGRMALQAAAEGGHEAIVEILVDAEADVNASPAKYGGRTALQAAAEGGHEAIVEILVDAKADVNASPAGSRGRTALQAAAEGGHEGVVKILVDAKADVNASPAEDGGRTALQAAAEGGHEGIVKILVDAEAEVNASPAQFDGRMALQAAVEGGHEAIVKILVDAKADVNASPARSYGRTALQAAAEGGYNGIVKLLIRAGAKIVLASHGESELIMKHFMKSPNLNFRAKNQFGLTPLHEALREYLKASQERNESRVEAVLTLIIEILEVKENGIDIKDHSGKSPLETATESNKPLPMLRRLVSKGADTRCLRTEVLTKLLRSEGEKETLQNIGLCCGPDGDTRILADEKGTGWPRGDSTKEYGGSNSYVILDPWIKISFRLPDSSVYESFIKPLGELSSQEITLYKDSTENIIDFRWYRGELTSSTSLFPGVPRRADIAIDVGGLKKVKATKPTTGREVGGKSEVEAESANIPDPGKNKLEVEVESANEMEGLRVIGYIRFCIFLIPDVEGAAQDGSEKELQPFTFTKQKVEISWIMTHPNATSCKNQPRYGDYHPEELFLRSLLYQGTLRLEYLSIPSHGAEFATLLLDDVHRRWLELLEGSRLHLEKMRDIQLEKGGKDPEIIRCLLQDSREWNKLRSGLQAHILKARELWERFKDNEALFLEVAESGNDLSYITDYLKGSEGPHIEKLEALVKLSKKVELIEKCIHEITDLKAETKDMIELEFNLVSIYEARESIEMSKVSNSMSLSMKRLSWITFIFLPLTFVSGLFGMNLDVLGNNPRWTWYFVIACPVLALVFVVWIVFKYSSISKWIEKNIGERLERLHTGKEDSGPGNSSASDVVAPKPTPSRRRAWRSKKRPHDTEQGKEPDSS